MIWLLIAGIALALVYEVLAAVQNKGGTISQIIWGWNMRWPLIPFAFGVLAGHLFWQR